jgi:putative effector of murein hydrolase LrgA (UPF0299 family)
MKRDTATLIAFLTVPVIPSLVGAVLTPETRRFDVVTIVVFAGISYLISAAVAALFGAPIFFWLRRINLVRWWSALITGFVVGAVMALVVRLPSLAHMREILLLGLEGAVSAFVFWLIWKQGREPSSTKRDEIRHGS